MKNILMYDSIVINKIKLKTWYTVPKFCKYNLMNVTAFATGVLVCYDEIENILALSINLNW